MTTALSTAQNGAKAASKREQSQACSDSAEHEQARPKGKAAGIVSDIWQMRAIIANSIDLVKYEPQDKAIWDKAYDKYLDITKL